MATVKAIGITELGAPDVLKPLEIPRPVPESRDLLVRVKAVATNPVDTKKRKGSGKLDTPRILGWDASGIVEEIGKDVTLFKVGDEVYFAGSIRRPGCNAELTLVDERIVGKKPKTLSFEEAAAIPLTALTAWEGMVEQMGIPVPHTEEQKKRNQKKVVLVIAGAGGVGSIAIQIAKKVLETRVIGTASRQESIDYCKKMGADDTIDHKKNLKEELQRIGLSGVDYIMNCSDTADKYDALSGILNPLGKICCIVETDVPLNVGNLMAKRGTFTWELMFTRSIFGVDMEYQGEILNTVADLLDKKVLVTTVTHIYENMTFLIEAHQKQETSTAIGKIVLKAVF